MTVELFPPLQSAQGWGSLGCRGNLEVGQPPDGGSPVRLTNNPAVDGEPAWSPDGHKIVFTSNRTGLFNFQIYVMSADGSGQTRLITDPAVDVSPQW
jgi:TolB protein